VAVLRVKAADELVQVCALERVRLESEVHVRAQVVDPELVRPGLLAPRLAIKEKDVCLDALRVEDAGR
jgi:hypothetical protein